MENIQILKHCPWISDVINLKEYFKEYHEILDEINGKPHTEKFDKNETLRDFFHLPEDLEGPISRRSTPAFSYHARTNSTESNEPSSSSKAGLHPKTSSKKHFDKSYVSPLPLRSKSADDIELAMGSSGEERELESDPFSVKKMEENCSVDLLIVDGELPPRSVCESGPIGDSGRVTNWYAGAFMDGVIPDGGPDKLVTLANQARELYKRETVRDYTRLRHRLLKYSSTVRMVMNKENSPENISFEDIGTTACLRDTIFNIRVQRPYHKKSYQKKGINRYPKHSQEFYMLGSQKLSELRDYIICINDVYVHEDMSENPDRSRIASLTSLSSQFTSAFFYINGVCYSDMRDFRSVDNSETIKKWAKRYPNIGPMTTEKMEDVKLEDLSLRLGYPYAYQHLGNCEHLITFTDIRLHHRTDIQAPEKYPLSRGNPIKLSVTCYACSLRLANWILKDDPRIPAPYVHLCDHCLQLFCYDDKGNKGTNFKVFPFLDEFSAREAKEKSERTARNVRIKIQGPDGKKSTLLIEPFFKGE